MLHRIFIKCVLITLLYVKLQICLPNHYLKACHLAKYSVDIYDNFHIYRKVERIA